MLGQNLPQIVVRLRLTNQALQVVSRSLTRAIAVAQDNRSLFGGDGQVRQIVLPSEFFRERLFDSDRGIVNIPIHQYLSFCKNSAPRR